MEAGNKPYEDLVAKETLRAYADYYSPPEGGFWRWAEDARVLEWENGLTVAYRAYVEKLLAELTPANWPSLSSVVLIVAATRDWWFNPTDTEQVFGTTFAHFDDFDDLYRIDTTEARDKATGALVFLNLLRTLPEELRYLSSLPQLLNTLFAPVDLPDWYRGDTFAHFKRGDLDEVLLRPNEEFEIEDFVEVLDEIRALAVHFPDAASIVEAFGTGLKALPEPVEVQLPEPVGGNVLKELEEDNATFGLAQLTRRLQAAIRIPLHTQGSSDLPFGGVSDITNRGDFDRLLLSELAYDDATLMARLANNEALYLRREEPPQNLVEQRTVLVDSTLRMWGMPRLYAIAAALACIVLDREELTISAYALAGSAPLPIDLQSKAGVVEAMGILRPDLDCTGGMQLWYEELYCGETEEVILVTHARMLKRADFLGRLAEIRAAIGYLILVNREGKLQFYQLSGGRRKLLNQAKLNLEALLFARPRRKHRPQGIPVSEAMPAFYPKDPSARPKRMLFPAPPMRMNAKNTFAPEGWGIISVTQNRRALYWDRYSGRAAREVVAALPEGDCRFALIDRRYYVLLILEETRSYPVRKWLFIFDPATDAVQEMDLTEDKGVWVRIDFHQEFLYVRSFHNDVPQGRETFHRIDLVKQEMVDLPDGPEVRRMLYRRSEAPPQLPFQQIKMAVNQGYSTVKTARRVSIDRQGYLRLDRRRLVEDTSQEVQWREVNDSGSDGALSVPTDRGENIFAAQLRGSGQVDARNPRMRFQYWTWPDGSVLIVDTRGLLHLRSSDPDIPEIAVPYIVGMATAKWDPEDGFAGNIAFAPPSLHPDYKARPMKNIQRFIDHIIAQCS
ncbi:MAG: hypothetical protein AAGN35_08155 [Bacteroidota bacterium]